MHQRQVFYLWNRLLESENSDRRIWRSERGRQDCETESLSHYRSTFPFHGQVLLQNLIAIQSTGIRLRIEMAKTVRGIPFRILGIAPKYLPLIFVLHFDTGLYPRLNAASVVPILDSDSGPKTQRFSKITSLSARLRLSHFIRAERVSRLIHQFTSLKS